MKKIFALILSLLMLLPQMSFISTAEEAEKTIFNAFDIYYDANVAVMTNTDLVLEEKNGDTYIVANATPGAYPNGSYCLTIKSSAFNFNLVENPIVAIGYTTNATTNGIDATIMYNGKESWASGNSVYKIVSNEKNNIVYFDITEMNSKVDIKPDYKSIDLRLKLWGAHGINIPKEEYFAISYIAFFKTLDEAKAFNFTPISEEEYFAKNDLKIIRKNINEYDEDTLIKYIAKEEALKYEIIHSPNTEFPQAKKTYFVSPDGDDNNDGLSPEAAWKTVDKVNNTKFGKDDVIRFERGGIWRERIKLNGGAIYSSYG